MVEIRTVCGPLDEEHIGWIADLYGPVDHHYASRDYVRHQFVDNPFGWSANVFAVDDGVGIAHCGVVPFRARRGDTPFVAGKLEALAVAESHRGGRMPSGRSIAIEVLSTLYPFALENGVEIVFGLAPPNIAPIHVKAGCRAATIDAPTYVLVTKPRDAKQQALALGQRALLGTAYALGRIVTWSWERPEIGEPLVADADLVEATAGDGEWTVSGSDAWDWYMGSAVLQAVDLGGSRAIVRLERGANTQIVAWRPKRPGLLPALLLLGALARLARRSDSPTLRFQPWRGSGGDNGLARACALLGFVRRGEATVVLSSTDPAFEKLALRLTPFLHVTF